jgi:hypothetical protein
MFGARSTASEKRKSGPRSPLPANVGVAISGMATLMGWKWGHQWPEHIMREWGIKANNLQVHLHKIHKYKNKTHKIPLYNSLSLLHNFSRSNGFLLFLHFSIQVYRLPTNSLSMLLFLLQ